MILPVVFICFSKYSVTHVFSKMNSDINNTVRYGNCQQTLPQKQEYPNIHPDNI